MLFGCTLSAGWANGDVVATDFSALLGVVGVLLRRQCKKELHSL